MEVILKAKMDKEKKAIIKISTLGILGGALSLSTFYFLNRFLISLDFNELWFVLGGSVLFLVVFSLQVFFIDDTPLLVVLSILQAALPVVVFLPYLEGRISLYLLAGSFALLALFLIVSARQGRNILNNGLNVRYFSAIHSVVPRALVGLFIFMCLISYFYFFQIDKFTRETGENLFHQAVLQTEPVMQVWYPGVTFDMTIEEAITKMSEIQLQRSRVDLLQEGIQLSELPPNIRNDLVNDVRDNVTQSLEQRIGPITPGETFESYLFGSVSGFVEDLSVDTLFFVEIGAIFLIYLLLKGLSFIIFLPTEALAFVMVKLLFLANFADIVLDDVTKEIITIE